MEYIDFDKILQEEFTRTFPTTHRVQLIEEARNFTKSLLYKYLTVAIKDKLVKELLTQKEFDNIKHYKAVIASTEVIKSHIDTIALLK